MEGEREGEGKIACGRMEDRRKEGGSTDEGGRGEGANKVRPTATR